MKMIRYQLSIICLIFFLGSGFSQENEEQSAIVTEVAVSDESEKVKLPFGELPKERVVGSTSTIKQSEMTTADLDVNSALIGRAAGLYVTKWNSQPGNDGTSLLIRGNHTIGDQTPMVVIDGVANRDLESLNFYEIESITVLKDVTAKALYGAQAANGVILVTTKRGKVGVKEATINAEVGFRKPTHIPDFVDAANYAQLYNEALINDGRQPLYSDEDIARYQTAGPNDTLANVDYYDRYVKPFTSFTRVYGTYTNSDNKFAYFVSGGVVSEDGLEAVGQDTDYNRINVRGNLDFNANELLSFRLDLATKLEFINQSALEYNDFFSSLSSLRPNEYPIYIDEGKLGWSPDQSTHIEGELVYGGYRKTEYRTAQLRSSAIMDFAAVGIDGLTWDNTFAIDANSSVSYGKDEEYAQFSRDGVQVGENDPVSGQSTNFTSMYRNIALMSTLNYDKQFGSNDLTLTSNFMFQNRERGGLDQPTKNMNVGARANYTYDSKYIAEVNLSYMGTNILEKGNRFQMFPSMGIGWVASNEGFLSSSTAIDFLKLRASYGQMGFDSNIPFFAYRSAYNWSGSASFGPDNNPISNGAFYVTTFGNDDIGFEVATDLNIGLSAVLFDRLSLEFDYFNENRTNIPMQVRTAYPDVLGIDNLPTLNFGETSNKGVELELGYSGEVGELGYNVSGFYSYTKGLFEKTGDLEAEDYLNRDGQPIDRILGYTAEGFYTDAADVDVISTLGGSVTAGDLKYTDINEDGVINNEDRSLIGNSLPRHLFGMNFNVGYKNFNLFVLGQGAAGFNRLRNGLTSYTGRGDQKFAANAQNAYHATTNPDPNASHPRLTSATGTTHSYVGSTYWMTDAYYFTLRNVELSYSFPSRITDKIGNASGFRVFVRGTDLLSFSEDNDFNSDNPAAGLTNGFLMSTVSIGLNLSY